MEGTDTSTLTLSAWDDWFDSDTDSSVNDDYLNSLLRYNYSDNGIT